MFFASGVFSFILPVLAKRMAGKNTSERTCFILSEM